MAENGMIILPRSHPILEKAVKHQLELAQEVQKQDPNLDSKEKKKLGSVAMTFFDFENSSWKVSLNPRKSTTMTISLNLPCYDQISKVGVEDVLKKKFSNLLTDTEEGYSVSLAVDVMSPGQPIDTITSTIASLKETILAAPFIEYFNGVLTKSPKTEVFSFDLRPDTRIYLIPGSERVTVTMRLSLQDPVDLEVASIFLKDYKDVQRRKAARAPPAHFSLNPPEELSGEEKGGLGFISFSIQKIHLTDLQATAAALINFRSFLQYHLKCSKAFFHSRMRKKVKEFLKVLNRAKTDYSGETKKKIKKTASGRTFKKRF